MENRCLYCYEPVEVGRDFHEKCSLEFFGTLTPPAIEYSLDQMDELAKNVVERSVAVPGVQAKLSMSLVKDVKGESDTRLTVIGALISMVYMYLFTQFIEPDFIINIVEINRIKTLEAAPQITDEQLEMSSNITRDYFYAFTFGFVLIFNLFIGFLTGLVTGLVMKNTEED